MGRVGIGVAIGVVVVALAGVVFFISQNIDGVVKDMIETIGSDVTGSKVQVAEVKLSLADGAGTINGMTVANPEGFSPTNVFALNSITVSVDSGSLTEDVYVINSINIDGASVLAEQKGTGTNIQALMKAMEGEAEAASDSSQSQGSEDVLLAVQELNFTNGNLLLKSDVFGERSLTLPDFTLRDLGTAESGLTPDELGSEIGFQLTRQVSKAVMDELSGLASKAAADKLKEKIGEKTAEGLKKLKGLFD